MSSSVKFLRPLFHLQIRKFAWVLLLFFGNYQTLYAQRTMNHAGKDFWIALHKAFPVGYTLVYISGAQNANVTITCGANGLTQNYSFQGGTVLPIMLSVAQVSALQNPPVAAVHKQSLHVTSDADIVVHLELLKGTDDEGALVYPSDNQQYGNEYYLNGPPMVGSFSINNPTHGSFSIVNRCDSTELEITPAKDARNHAAGIPFTVTLRRGECYILPCAATSRDLSGTKVVVKYASCCNPINVFLTYEVNYIYWPLNNGPCCADQLLEQILPVSLWTNYYPMVSLRNNHYNLIKIVSGSNNNAIYFDGVSKRTLQDGQGFDTIISGAVIVSSDAPVSITEHMVSQGAAFHTNGVMPPADSMSDPASLLMLPLSNGVTDAYLKTVTNLQNPSGAGFPNVGNLLNDLMLITATANVPSVQLNNTSVASQFAAFPGNAAYSYARIPLDTSKICHLTAATPVNAYYYAAYVQGSSAFALGDVHTVNFQDTAAITTDTITACFRDSINIVASQADSYLWSDGGISQSITVRADGLYSVRKFYADSCDVIIKRYQVYFRQPDIIAATDTTLLTRCSGETLTLTAGKANAYLWSNGDTTRHIDVRTGGSFSVSLSYYDSCSIVTHFYRVVEKAYSTRDVADTLFKCIHQTLTLKADTADSYLWQDHSVLQTLNVTDPGVYTVVETTRSNCFIVNHRFDVNTYPSEPFSLLEDTSMCAGDQIMLKGINDNTHWSDGSIGLSFAITQPGTYWCETLDTCNNSYVRDTIVVRDSLCAKNYCNIAFPSAFTPDHDGRNDVFRPVVFGEFPSYTLFIYNRWGEKIFQAYNTSEAWDGTYKGMPADLGVYYYICTYGCSAKGKQTLQLKGDVTLIR